MDSAYANTVRLLLTVASDVFAGDIFAMKGGTAINLFVRDMPRLSVDIDVVYTAWRTPRASALAEISRELDSVARTLARAGFAVRTIGSKDLGDTKLLIDNGEQQVRVEVNGVFRGTVLPVERRGLCPRTADMFSVDLELPMLAPDELYGGKLVAAMDRQHPRDLFDVWQLFETEGISGGMIECFVTYLAGHNRPIHEVLFGRDKDISREYHGSFVGLTTETIDQRTLLQVRTRLRRELSERLTANHRQFLIGLAHGTPDWTLLACPHAADLPAIRWKLENLQTFSRRRLADFEAQAAALEAGLRGE